MENQFDWAGCVVTPEVIREMNKKSTTFQHCSCQGNIIEHYFKCEPLLIWCQLPHKIAELSGAALNWCYPLSDEDNLPEGDIIHAFNEPETPDSHLSNKINNTLSFFKTARNINRDVLFAPCSESVISKYCSDLARLNHDFQAKFANCSSSDTEELER